MGLSYNVLIVSKSLFSPVAHMQCHTSPCSFTCKLKSLNPAWEIAEEIWKRQACLCGDKCLFVLFCFSDEFLSRSLLFPILNQLSPCFYSVSERLYGASESKWLTGSRKNGTEAGTLMCFCTFTTASTGYTMHCSEKFALTHSNYQNNFHK